MDYCFAPDLLQHIVPKLSVPEGFSVRPLRLSDVNNGYIDLMAQLTDAGSPNPERVIARFLEIAAMKPLLYHIIVIEETASQKVVGSGTLVLELKFIHDLGMRGRIEDIVVDKSKRGFGFGVLLNEALVALAKDFGVYKLSLECKDALIPFYARFGFKKDEGNNFCVQRFGV